MHTRITRIGLMLILVAALVASGCGSSKKSSSSGGKKGGEVTILEAAGGVDSLDPGYWYYQTDYSDLGQTVQRQLYGWPPDATQPVPDLATAKPTLANGGKTITIKIKPGIKYAPPHQTRVVKSADFKYALERCFLPSVGNGYAGVYYSGITGVKAFQAGKAKEISGITTPDDSTLVIKTDQPQGVLTTGNALALPCTSPVPKEIAAQYDAKKTSTYGEHQAYTGPYMIAGTEKTGAVTKTGYSPGKLLALVRNPSWDKSTDFRPANFDKITFKGGNDVTVASRQILNGQGLMSGDYAAPPTAILKSALASKKDQLNIAPSQGIRFISLNTKVKPLDNINVRKAITAATDREALRVTRGGPTLGPIANHLIPPEMPGFEEAGGLQGPGYDFLANPKGDLNLAKSYMKKAGYKSGLYSGPPILVISDNQDPASKTGQAFAEQIKQLGFKLNFRQVQHADVISKFCGTPKAGVAICPTLGWGKDFFDSQSMLDPILNGKNIVPVGNTNEPQANDPTLNAAMDKAETLVDPTARAKAWAAIDKQATGQAFYIPWLWDNQINFASKNVNGVKNKFNSSWDLTASSLK
ncbi:MAG: peptide/nickel transport system substrate-binding protein [Actinomycetota bacterium]|jgi:peptide/nickel transport system substrate-binding protein|nr:peptide/nickel transport system substrate-binding protein [Actinomycetota bacterium]